VPILKKKENLIEERLKIYGKKNERQRKNKSNRLK